MHNLESFFITSYAYFSPVGKEFLWYKGVMHMPAMGRSKLGIRMSALSIAGLGLLWCVSVLFPTVTAGLSNGSEYIGLLAFLIMHNMEPGYWLLCVAMLAGLCVLLFDKGSVNMVRIISIMLFAGESIALLFYFTDAFTRIRLPEIVLLTIWLLIGLSGVIFYLFSLINKKVSTLTSVIFGLGLVILALGGFMRLFLTM